MLEITASTISCGTINNDVFVLFSASATLASETLSSFTTSFTLSVSETLSASERLSASATTLSASETLSAFATESSSTLLFKNGFKTKYLISAGVSHPDYLISKGYKPVKVYKTGDFNRGVYLNVDNETVLQCCCADHDQKVTRNLFSLIKRYIKNPFHNYSYQFMSKKIVRAVMFERL